MVPKATSKTFISCRSNYLMSLELQILVLQFVSAIFMGADYYLLEKHRQNASLILFRYAERYQSKLNNLIAPTVNQFLLLRKGLIPAFAIFLSLILLAKAKWFWSELGANEWVFLAAFIIFVLIGAVVLSYLHFVTMTVVLPVLIIGVPMSIVWFVKRCPKGAIFGIGYITLLLSFSLRFYAVSA